jgi:hypothetical protein
MNIEPVGYARLLATLLERRKILQRKENQWQLSGNLCDQSNHRDQPEQQHWSSSTMTILAKGGTPIQYGIFQSTPPPGGHNVHIVHHDTAAVSRLARTLARSAAGQTGPWQKGGQVSIVIGGERRPGVLQKMVRAQGSRDGLKFERGLVGIEAVEKVVRLSIGVAE